jgi:kynureninase
LALTDRSHAAALDAADPLGAYRERFVIVDPSLIYLDGNSLGRLPAATAARLVRTVTEEWGDGLIRSWDQWIDLPTRVGDRIARAVLGAEPGEVVVADSTTVNFYKLAVAALDARPDRRVIITDVDNFPTDRYVLEGMATARGATVRWLEVDTVAGPQLDDVAPLLADDVALVTFSHVAYRSGARADMTAITSAAHEVGALALWDLSHSAGSVPVALGRSNVDLAVGCTYKYLHGGPGSPAWLFVRKSLQSELKQPIWGWFGQRDQFAMGSAYQAQRDLRAFLSGTPSVLALAAIDEGVALVEEAGIAAVADKGRALTDYAIALYNAWLADLGFLLGTPRESEQRGAHISIRRADADVLCTALVGVGVVTDFRRPDAIRLGLAPLTTRFVDVWQGLAKIRDLAK